jgi:tRNA nucleotidyltransferase (CCA-adding enzyme)
LERLSVYEEYMSRPHVSGNDLIEAGLTPGKDFSDFLSYAHKLRLAGIEKEEALKQTLAYAVKARKKT